MIKLIISRSGELQEKYLPRHCHLSSPPMEPVPSTSTENPTDMPAPVLMEVDTSRKAYLRKRFKEKNETIRYQRRELFKKNKTIELMSTSIRRLKQRYLRSKQEIVKLKSIIRDLKERFDVNEEYCSSEEVETGL